MGNFTEPQPEHWPVLLEALETIESACEQLAERLPDYPSGYQVRVDALLGELAREGEHSRNYIQRLSAPISGTAEGWRKLYREAFDWVADDYFQPPVPAPKYHLPKKLLLARQTIDAKELHLRIRQIEDRVDAAEGRLIDAYSRDAIVFFTEVHNVHKTVDWLGSWGIADRIFRTCTTPLAMLCETHQDVFQGKFTDTYLIGVYTDCKELPQVIEDIMVAISMVVENSRHRYGNHPRLRNRRNRPGLMVSVGAGKVALAGGELKTVSDGVLNAYDVQGVSMRPHQVCVTPRIFHDYLPKKYKQEPYTYQRHQVPTKYKKRVTVYELDLLHTGLVGFRAKRRG